MNKRNIITIILALVSLVGLAHGTETDSIPDGIFFRISGGGLNKPSYILGTMHSVSRVWNTASCASQGILCNTST